MTSKILLFTKYLKYIWKTFVRRIYSTDEKLWVLMKTVHVTQKCWMNLQPVDLTPSETWRSMTKLVEAKVKLNIDFDLKLSILLRWIKQLWHNGEVKEKLNNSLECECCLDEYYLCTYKDIFLWHWSTMRLEIHADFYLVSCWGVALRSRWLVRHSDFGSLLWLGKDIG